MERIVWAEEGEFKQTQTQQTSLVGYILFIFYLKVSGNDRRILVQRIAMFIRKNKGPYIDGKSNSFWGIIKHVHLYKEVGIPLCLLSIIGKNKWRRG